MKYSNSEQMNIAYFGIMPTMSAMEGNAIEIMIWQIPLFSVIFPHNKHRKFEFNMTKKSE